MLVFHTEWLGVSPSSTEGEDNVVGSTRNVTVPTQVGTYNFTEEVRRKRSSKDYGWTAVANLLQ